MTAASDYLENQILSTFFTAARYVTLGTAAFNEDGTGGGTTTAVQSCTFTGSGNAYSNSGVVSFASAPSGTYGYVAVWDDSSKTHLLLKGALSATKASDGTDTLSFAIGELDITVD